MKTLNIEATLKRHGDFLRSCHAAIEDNWIILFWRGALIVDHEPCTDIGKEQNGIQLWQYWLSLPRFPLSLGSVATMMFEGDRYALQSFVSETGELMYLKREIRDYLPKRGLAYWHTGSQSKVIVVTEESTPIAVFSRFHPRGPVSWKGGV